MHEKLLGDKKPIVLIQACDSVFLVSNSAGETILQNGSDFLKFKTMDGVAPTAACVSRKNVYMALPKDMEHISFDKKTTNSKFYRRGSSKLTKIYVLPGDTLLGVWRRGFMFLQNGNVLKAIDFEQKLNCTAFARDTVWFGTETGLYYFPIHTDFPIIRAGGDAVAGTSKPLIYPQFEKRIGEVPVTAISFDDKGNLLIGVKSESLGLLKASDDREICAPPGEIINVIKSVNNFLIIGTNRGAYLLLDSINKEKKCTWYTLFVGEVVSAEYFENSLYILSTNTLDKIDLYKLLKNGERVIFRYAYTSFDDQQKVREKKFVVPNAITRLEFKFDKISFNGSSPPLIYQLTGALTENAVRLSSSVLLERLVPGEYTLTVKPDVPGGMRYQTQIEFEVLPAWYQKPLAIFFFISAVISLLLVSIWWYVKRAKRKLQEKNTQEQLLVEYKLIALKAQVNPHFISNCLAAIQNLIVKGNTHDANLYVARFGFLVRKILDYSGKSFISLAEELELVQLYVQMEEVRFSRTFAYELEVVGSISTKECMVPSLLLNPIVENAIWHGLLKTQLAYDAKIRIHVNIGANLLVVKISDNGLGLAIKKTPDIMRVSYGLDITDQRIKNLNYLLNTDLGRVEIFDNTSYSDATFSTGATVILHLPYDNS